MDDPKRDDYVKLLKDHGWDDEKAEAFLDNKVVYQSIQIPAAGLVRVLNAVTAEGIPLTPTAVTFVIPDGRIEQFNALAREAIAEIGGTVMTREDHEAFAAIDKDTVH